MFTQSPNTIEIATQTLTIYEKKICLIGYFGSANYLYDYWSMSSGREERRGQWPSPHSCGILPIHPFHRAESIPSHAGTNGSTVWLLIRRKRHLTSLPLPKQLTDLGQTRTCTVTSSNATQDDISCRKTINRNETAATEGDATLSLDVLPHWVSRLTFPYRLKMTGDQGGGETRRSGEKETRQEWIDIQTVFYDEKNTAIKNQIGWVGGRRRATRGRPRAKDQYRQKSTPIKNNYPDARLRRQSKMAHKISSLKVLST